MSFVFNLIATFSWPEVAYYILPVRMWQMFCGGLVVFIPFILNHLSKILVEILGVLLIVFSYVFFSDESYWPGVWAILPTLGAFFVIYAKCGSAITNNIVFQKIGLWSYSIYLWHWPIFLTLNNCYDLDRMLSVIGISLSVVIGAASFYLVENNRALKTIKFLIFIFIATFSLSIFLSDGFNVKLRPVAYKFLYVDKFNPDVYLKNIRLAEIYPECNFYDVELKKSKLFIDSRCTLQAGSGGVFLWGDSHAQALSYGLRKVVGQGVSFYQVATSECMPLIDKEVLYTRGETKKACDKSNEFAVSKIIELNPDVIILAQNSRHEKNDFFKISSYLRKNNVESKIFLIGAVPQWRPSLPKIIAEKYMNQDVLRIKDDSFVERLFLINSWLSTEYGINSDVEYISILDSLCNEDGCIAKVDNSNTPLVWDYGHLSLEGSVFVAKNVIYENIKIFSI